jgi:hypothetical protein
MQSISPAIASPAPLVPEMTGEGSLDCGRGHCSAGHEICCEGVCKSFSPTDASSMVEAIGTLCSGDLADARAFRRGAWLRACSDSSQCVPGAICCPASVRSSVETDLVDMAYFRVHVCTSNPASDCAELELCDGASCRVPRRETRIPCGSSTCSGDKPICRYDASDLPGSSIRRLPPVCAAPDDPPRPVLSEYEVACRSPRDCPRGAQCVAYFFSSMDSWCLYNHTPTTLAFAAPVCQSDADCADVLPHWKRFGLSDGFVAHCRPLAGDPAHRSICLLPWTAADATDGAGAPRR